MQYSVILENSLKAYLQKQKNFRALVKGVQRTLQDKKYKHTNSSFEDFIKSRWNISKAQAYRYLISAKVIDQLEEFDIQPCYERICRSLYNCAKTPKQMKLLWGSILRTAGNRPDSINSSHVKKMWKQLCADKNYNKICHYEDEIMNKIEKSLNEYSKDSKQRQIKSIDDNNTHSNNYPSPIMNVPIIPSNNNINTVNEINNYYNTPYTQVEYPLLTISTQPSQQETYYPSPIQTSPSSNNIYNKGNNVKPLNITTLSVPSVNVIKYPVYEVQLPSPLPTQVPSQLPSPLPTQVPPQLPSPLPTQIPPQLPSPLPTEVPPQLPTVSINNQCAPIFTNYQEQPQQIVYYY
ncbi:hypothetical protein U3516DRAFT_834887 [Neocallimastix sp. 'constans']|jgi:hypothetical protein